MESEVMLTILLSFWYIWLIIIAFAILGAFAPKIKGYLGEKSVAFFLSRLDLTVYKVINNLMINNGQGTSQIDHVVVSNFGIFVIETKNYRGWILGSERSDNWTQVVYKRKEKLHNSIRQNYGHIQALKLILKDFPDIIYYPIVVFTMRANLKLQVTSDVVYTVNLLRTIKKYQNLCLSDDIKNKIYDTLVSINIDSKENRQTHVQTIRTNLAEQNIKVANDICPKCG
jgi:hypothetical protein